MNLIKIQNWLDNASYAVLLATMLVYWVGAAFPKLRYLATLGTTGIVIANLSIAALLSARWIEAGYFPLSNLYESLFFLAWGITTVHLIAESNTKSRLVGVVTSPVAMAISAFAALTLPQDMQASAPLVPALKSNWLMMHVSVMMLSYSALIVGSLLAIAFLVVTKGQHVELRGSSVGTGGYRDNGYRLQRANDNPLQPQAVVAPTTAKNENKSNVATAVLEVITTQQQNQAAIAPSMPAPHLSVQRLSLAQTLDNISYRIIGLGFPLLTIGIIAGGVWANEAWGSYWSWDPKETWALITWLVFAAYLHSRITKGWLGRSPAILASVGFVVVWVCYLGVNLLGRGLHSYGWFF